jgi:RecJ-like exonuclease
LTDEKCAVCKGDGIIELLGSECPFCNGTVSQTNLQNHTLILIFVNVFFLTEKDVLYVESYAIMIRQTNQKFF